MMRNCNIFIRGHINFFSLSLNVEEDRSQLNVFKKYFAESNKFIEKISRMKLKSIYQINIKMHSMLFAFKERIILVTNHIIETRYYLTLVSSHLCFSYASKN